jgi:hypothetical protein
MAPGAASVCAIAGDANITIIAIVVIDPVKFSLLHECQALCAGTDAHQQALCVVL